MPSYEAELYVTVYIPVLGRPISFGFSPTGSTSEKPGSSFRTSGGVLGPDLRHAPSAKQTERILTFSLCHTTVEHARWRTFKGVLARRNTFVRYLVSSAFRLSVAAVKRHRTGPDKVGEPV